MAGAVLAVAFLVSCSGSDGADPAPPLESSEPITAPPSADPATTSTATTTSSTTSSTLPETTSTTAETSTTTEPAPTSTTLEDLRQQIEADLNAGEQAFLRAGGNPGDSDSTAEVENYFSGTSLIAVEAFYERLAAEGNVLAPGETVGSSHTVLDVLDSSDNTATIRNCRIDAARTVRATDPNEIVDGDVVRYISINTLEFSDGLWKLSGGETLTREIGPRACDG